MALVGWRVDIVSLAASLNCTFLEMTSLSVWFSDMWTRVFMCMCVFWGGGYEESACDRFGLTIEVSETRHTS